jgi:hypothetical protein
VKLTTEMLIVTNKMQRNTILFIVVKALHVSGGFPAHHQEHLVFVELSCCLLLAVDSNNKEYCITLHLVGYN